MGSLIILIPFAALIYFMMIRPQQRQAREHAAFLKSLEPGSEVVTSSGLYGTVAEIDGTIIWLEVAQDLELKFDRSAISRPAAPAPVEADEETS